MRQALEQFYAEQKFNGKGPLSVAVQLTRAARNSDFPLNPEDFLTGLGGQVKGLGGPNLKAILKEYGIDRVLTKEGARTSRGSISNMRSYVEFLNTQHQSAGPLDWDEIEQFWIGKVQDYFASDPVKLSVDASNSVRFIVRDLISQITARQKAMPGATFLGTMMQHLVGAKLEVILGYGNIVHNCASNNDQNAGRTGDFDISDSTIHVTSSPSEALLEKCRENITANRKPIIITLDKGVDTAEVLAENIGISTRIDIIDFVQFIVTNIHEHSLFRLDDRHVRIEELIECYNKLIDTYETEPSLKIEVARGR